MKFVRHKGGGGGGASIDTKVDSPLQAVREMKY